jgi:hypothetical protein
MYKDQIIRALVNATLLIVRFLKGDISLQEFVKEYGSFYYYEALDGHEADDEQKQVLNELQDIVVFHEKIQYEVVDAVYFEGNEKNIGKGRLTPDQAKEHFERLCYEYDVENILNKLSDKINKIKGSASLI